MAATTDMHHQDWRKQSAGCVIDESLHLQELVLLTYAQRAAFSGIWCFYIVDFPAQQKEHYLPSQLKCCLATYWRALEWGSLRKEGQEE